LSRLPIAAGVIVGGGRSAVGVIRRAPLVGSFVDLDVGVREMVTIRAGGAIARIEAWSSLTPLARSELLKVQGSVLRAGWRSTLSDKTGASTFEGGGRLVCNTPPYRYVWPSKPDLKARINGLRLLDRWADWHRQPFTSDSVSQVAVFEKMPSQDRHTRLMADAGEFPWSALLLGDG
jgi:hypothetical protein